MSVGNNLRVFLVAASTAFTPQLAQAGDISPQATKTIQWGNLALFDAAKNMCGSARNDLGQMLGNLGGMNIRTDQPRHTASEWAVQKKMLLALQAIGDCDVMTADLRTAYCQAKLKLKVDDPAIERCAKNYMNTFRNITKDFKLAPGR